MSKMMRNKIAAADFFYSCEVNSHSSLSRYRLLVIVPQRKVKCSLFSLKPIFFIFSQNFKNE